MSHKNHFIFRDHETGDGAIVETHNGGDAIAIFAT